MNCILFHKWAKWSEPKELLKTTYLYAEVAKSKVMGQSRECDKCGKIQLREIGGV